MFIPNHPSYALDHKLTSTFSFIPTIANPRQVVLCLLDVARIACVKHGFFEAPGLVKFEQEIDRELAAEKAAITDKHHHPYSADNIDPTQFVDKKQSQESEHPTDRTLSSLARNSRGGSIGDATDDLIMRYCKHKEEEAAKKKASELEASAKLKRESDAEAQASSLVALDLPQTIQQDSLVDSMDTGGNCANTNDTNAAVTANRELIQPLQFEADSLLLQLECKEEKPENLVMKSTTDDITATHKNNLNYDNRVDSLDSGESRTESASTSHIRTPVNLGKKHGVSAIPIPIKRSNSSSSLASNQTSSMGTSELSSSRSSLLSGQESSSAKLHIAASDLDGKVMRIAKSYYGKGATKGVTRLSEGKYKIADRIVFVRLLKGHRVMVRIGGGWDTLENFLFRHKSDPSQVIDVDNLLPLETKMSFEKATPQSTPTSHNKFSKLPYYRRSSSASSTNLSISNLSISNHSPTSSSTAASNGLVGVNTPPHIRQELLQRQQVDKQQIPYLFIHRSQDLKPSTQAASYNQNDPSQSPYPKGTTNISHLRAPNSSIRPTNRPLGNSKTPTASSTNLYPATLTTRLASTKGKAMGRANLHNGKTPRQEAFLKLGRSNDSLQASYYKTHQHRQNQQNGSSINGNLSAKRKVETFHRSNNGLFRQANSINN